MYARVYTAYNTIVFDRVALRGEVWCTYMYMFKNGISHRMMNDVRGGGGFCFWAAATAAPWEVNKPPLAHVPATAHIIYCIYT